MIIVNITRDNQLVVMSQAVAALLLEICIGNELNNGCNEMTGLGTATKMVAEKHVTILWL
ncbi:MAG: hypothetical protein J0G95_04370 [Rhizobiales bacterium]|nr:hypothetical protein [Hyphomicrobiales bacterium]